MLPFRTTLPSFKPGFEIDHHTSMICMGSCFAQHMSQRLQQLKFSCTSNPFGILYHPQNIANCIEMICNKYPYQENDLVKRDEHWFSLWHHSQFNSKNASALLTELQSNQEEALTKIKTTDLFIFTFGTAYYYQHIATGIDVANCHKLPAGQFAKKRSSVSEIVASFTTAVQKIISLKPNARFIFTVSPIRHIKDGILENTKSKAILHLAIDELIEKFDQAYYFPAYELLMDDLRDYRFYTSDLLHPSEVAVDYIWNHFQQHLFSASAKQNIEKINSIIRALAHSAFYPQSEAHQKFLAHTLEKISSLESENTMLDFSIEKERIVEEMNL